MGTSATSEDAEDDPDLRTSIHQRISILKQLMGKPDAYLPNKMYEEVYDPDDFAVKVDPGFVLYSFPQLTGHLRQYSAAKPYHAS